MKIWFIAKATLEDHAAEDLRALVDRSDGFVWVDIPVCDRDTAAILSDVFSFQEPDIQSCMDRNCVPKVHAYADHLFFVLHAPERGEKGHIHYVELDQFVGERCLVTVHALNPLVKHRDEVAIRETSAVHERIEAGDFRPSTPLQVSCEIVTALTMYMEQFIEDCTKRVWALEQRVTGDLKCDSAPFLEELFRTRHGLLAVRTMAALSEEIYGRLMVLARHEPPELRPVLVDVVDRFKRLEASAQAEQEYLEGVIDHYRARTDTSRTVAAVSLAVVAVVTLPVTALASVYGMNIIVNQQSDVPHVAVVLVVMVAMCILLLLWARRRRWFRW